MAGAHIEREARYVMTRRTPAERDEQILALRAKGWTYKQIGDRLGMTDAGVIYACRRLAGIPRRQSVRKDMCEGC